MNIRATRPTHNHPPATRTSQAHPGGREALNSTTAAGSVPAAAHTHRQADRPRTRRAVRLLIAAIVLAAIVAAGVWANIRFGEIPLAVGESGSVVSTATVDSSGRIRNVSSDPSEKYQFEAANGRFQTEFSTKAHDDASISLSTDRGTYLSFGLAASNNVPHTVKSNVIQFTPDQDIRVKYTVLDDRVKESIILLSPPKTNVITFNFSARGLKMTESPDGYHFYALGGEEIFWMLKPTVESFGSVRGSASLSISGSKMQLKIDKNFLDKAFYPVTIDPTVVGTSSDAAATAYTSNRKILEASDGTLILFYQRGADIVYKISTDYGLTWSAETVASTSNSTQFGATIDGNDNVYVTYLDDSAADAVRFRKLTYAGSGSWTAGNEWPVETTGTGRAYPDIFRTDAGRIWVAYRYFDGTNYTLRVRYSDSSLPGWTEDGSAWSESTEIAGPSPAPRMYPSFVYYKGQPSVAFLYPSGTNDGVVAWRYWRGSEWSNEETVSGVTVPQTTYPMFSAASTYDNDVHVLFSDSNGIKEVRRNDAAGNWSGKIAVSDGTGDAYPMATTSGGGVRVFWSSFVGTSQRQLVYKTFDGTYWDANPTVLTPDSERTFDKSWTNLAATPWTDTLTDRDALFRFSDGATNYGNQIGEDYSPGYALDAVTKKASVQFTADASTTVTAFRLYMNRVGTAPTYRIGIQTDATGYPSGSWLGGNAYVDAPNPGDGWTQFDIPDTDVASGTTYHIVMEYVGGVVNAQNCASFSFVAPNVTGGEQVTIYDGTSWATLNATPTYVLERSGSVFEGQSIRAYAAYALNSPGERAGERFTATTDVIPSSVEMRVARTGTPTGELIVKVVEDTDTELYSHVIATPSSPTSFTWLSAPASSLTLLSGHTYRVFVTSTGVDAANYYSVQMGVSGTGSPYPQLTWGGTTDTATTALSGSGWTDKTTATANTAGSDVPIFGSNGDTVYLGMTDKFDYVYFDLGVAASSSIGPTWEYWNGSDWSTLALTDNGDFDFTIDGQIAFTPPADWAAVALNGEATPKYYIRVARTAASVATAPIATQMTAVRNNSYPTTVVSYSTILPLAWTEGVGGPYRVKFDKLNTAAPEITGVEARHIDRDAHTSKITWATHVPATSQIVYDTVSRPDEPYNNYAFSTTLDATLTKSHLVTVSNLTSETVYYYRILSMNGAGDLTVSDERLIPPGDLAADTDICASCHRNHTAFRPDTWTDSQGDKHNGLLIRQP